jgi:1,5-anhydro-D-fructose reductase (1,5-anhydro-D-mannitol-forming)
MIPMSMLSMSPLRRLTSLHIVQYDRLAVGEAAKAWRFDPSIAGAGLFLDLASHGLDLLDFLVSPISEVAGFAINTGGTYQAEDVTGACFTFKTDVVGNGIWNFNADRWEDSIVFTGSAGELKTPVFTDGDIVLRSGGADTVFEIRNPPHVHQPLIQTIVDELLGQGKCESTGESGARASWVMDRCLDSYYRRKSY